MGLITVLHQPQRIENIGGVVRALMNMGQSALRLVEPAPFDAERIDAFAHRSGELVAGMTTHSALEEALADCALVVGFSARRRDQRQHRPWEELGPELATRAATEPIALVFGREDRGLENDALDRCGVLTALPVDPRYPSLNLADAVLLAHYDLRRLSGAGGGPRAAIGADEPMASQQEIDALIAQLDAILTGMRFSRNQGAHQTSMRTFRELVGRARPTERELALLRALAWKAEARPGSKRG